MRIAVERLHDIYRDFARAYQADEEEAGIFASCLLRADLRGHQTQGIGLLPYLDELFRAEVMHFGRTFEVVRDTPASALVDGHSGVGQVVGTRAMALAIAKAREAGVGLVTVRRSSDYGMASNYAIQAQEQGLIGISMSTGPLLVAPWGGRDARFCTNPLALAVPAGDRDPIVIDMATSAHSMGAVVLAARDNKLLGGKDVVDSDGQYTNDPSKVILNVMDRESRMSGALLPAGPKGFGMLLLVELLAGLLSGERTWQEEAPANAEDRAAFYGQTFLAISVQHFQAPDIFAAAMDRMIDVLVNAPAAKGFTHVRLPGSGAMEKEREYRANGILVRQEEWTMVEDVARRLGVSLGHAGV
jgi:LDH2 family malate/lactate/ureidoglycolate dehydrogenase